MPVLVPVKRILAVNNPFMDCPWGLVRPVTIEEIDAAVVEERFAEYDDPRNGGDIILAFKPNENDFRLCQIERIAWFVHHGWTDAISLDVGVPSLGFEPSWIVTDGNHRLCAAVYRDALHILATVQGDIDYGTELLGVNVDEGYEEQRT